MELIVFVYFPLVVARHILEAMPHIKVKQSYVYAILLLTNCHA